MKYTMPLRVRYSETVAGDYVNLHKILEYFQDCTIFHSDSLGYGIQKELDKQNAWFLLAWNVDIERYPVMGEEIKVVTEPYKMRGFYGYRRFFLYGENEELIVTADSLWIFMDLEKMMPKKIPADMADDYIQNVEDTTIRVKRKLSEEGEWERFDTIEVNRQYVDSNGHVNNAYYAMWAEQYLPEDFAIKHFVIDYRQSAYENDIVSIEKIEEENCIRCRFCNQDQKLISLVEFYR